MCLCRWFCISLNIICMSVLIALTDSSTSFRFHMIMEKDKTIDLCDSTTDVKADSSLSCVSLCSTMTDCCRASFLPNRTCRLDRSSSCSCSIAVHVGAVTIVNKTRGTCVSYHLLPNAMSYTNSKSECIANGMQLAVFRKETWFNKAMFHLGKVTMLGDMWIGMYWNDTGGNFQWEDNDNEVTQSIRWTDTEPNCMTSDPCSYGNPNQKCVRITTTYYFKTIYCDSPYYPLCQRIIEC